MTRVTGRWLGLLSACFAVATGCGGTRMKVPQAASRNPEWPVRGHSAHSVYDGELRIAGRAVKDVHRSESPITNQNRTVEPARRRYRFALVAESTQLDGECKESTDPHKLWLIRFGKGQVHLDCTCRERGELRAELALIDGQGTLRIPSAEYAVTPIRHSEQGKQKLDVLGYAFKGAQGTGALERTGSGRAWPPPALDARASVDLSCAYAALLLYRPEP